MIDDSLDWFSFEYLARQCLEMPGLPGSENTSRRLDVLASLFLRGEFKTTSSYPPGTNFDPDLDPDEWKEMQPDGSWRPVPSPGPLADDRSSDADPTARRLVGKIEPFDRETFILTVRSMGFNPWPKPPKGSKEDYRSWAKLHLSRLPVSAADSTELEPVPGEKSKADDEWANYYPAVELFMNLQVHRDEVIKVSERHRWQIVPGPGWLVAARADLEEAAQPSSEAPDTGLTKAARQKGGRQPKYNQALQEAVGRFRDKIEPGGERLTLSKLKDWIRQNASPNEQYSFEPPIPNCDDLYIDGSRLIWKDRHGRERDCALRSLERYIQRSNA